MKIEKYNRGSFLHDAIGIFEKEDGRRFCGHCGKMIRVGQRVREKEKALPKTTESTYYFLHYPECPNKESEK